jgi:hypothetical protein
MQRHRKADMPAAAITSRGLFIAGAVGLLGALGLAAASPYHIAYASFAPLNTAVYIADADGGHRLRVIAQRTGGYLGARCQHPSGAQSHPSSRR